MYGMNALLGSTTDVLHSVTIRFLLVVCDPRTDGIERWIDVD
jgi:hypothetical protein